MHHDTQFMNAQINAHSGAYGVNPAKIPTLSMQKAGNYKKGRLRIHGLVVAIENPAGTYRDSGKKWRVADHYGYIEGVKGADGDNLDCFVGSNLESEKVFVVNQVDHLGFFDEHKVMLGYSDAQKAQIAYQLSYDLGWHGLKSIVPMSLEQFKFWLNRGDKSIAVTSDSLPIGGNYEMKRTFADIAWNDQNPTMAIDDLLLKMRRMNADGEMGDLLLDNATMSDLTFDADSFVVLDALVSPFNRLKSKMSIIQKAMAKHSELADAAADIQISEPFKRFGSLQIAVIFTLNDGQTVSIFFHNPDLTPSKITPTDKLVSWKWMLNKKDVTIVVAPESGTDIPVNEVALRVMKLAEKNAASFSRAQEKKGERVESIKSLKAEISDLETSAQELKAEIEQLRKASQSQASSEPIQKQSDVLNGDGVPVVNPALVQEVQNVKAGEPVVKKAKAKPVPVEKTGSTQIDKSAFSEPKEGVPVEITSKIAAVALNDFNKRNGGHVRALSGAEYNKLKERATEGGTRIFGVRDTGFKGRGVSAVISSPKDSDSVTVRIQMYDHQTKQYSEPVEIGTNNTPEQVTAYMEQAAARFAESQSDSFDSNFTNIHAMSANAQATIAAIKEAHLKGLKAKDIVLEKYAVADGKEVAAEILRNVVENPASGGLPFVVRTPAAELFKGHPLDIKPETNTRVNKKTMTASGWMDLAAISAAKKDVRYYLNGIHIVPTGEIVATDGHRITLIKESPDVYQELLDKAGGMPEKNGDRYVTNHDQGLTIGHDGKLVEGTFPDYRRLIAIPNTESVTVNMANLSGIVKANYAAQKQLGEKLKYMTVKTGDGEIGINSGYLKDATDTFLKAGYSKVKAQINTSMGSLVLSSPDGKVTQVIMGMRVERQADYLKPISFDDHTALDGVQSNLDDEETAAVDANEFWW